MAHPSVDPPGPPPAGASAERLAAAIDAALADRQRQAPPPEPEFRRRLGEQLRAGVGAAPPAGRALKLAAIGGIAALSLALPLFGGSPPPPETPPTPTPTATPTPTPPAPQAVMPESNARWAVAGQDRR